jgi:hypothetical protein
MERLFYMKTKTATAAFLIWHPFIHFLVSVEGRL